MISRSVLRTHRISPNLCHHINGLIISSSSSSPLTCTRTIPVRCIYGMRRYSSKTQKDTDNDSVTEKKATTTTTTTTTQLAPNSLTPTELEQTSPPTAAGAPMKKPLWERIKHEVQHYKDGTMLLGYEIKVSFKLLLKLTAGYELTRRESVQLSRTLQDLLRLIPFSAFILIPFAELLLPIALKVFPNLLPSTYESTAEKNKKKQTLLATRNKTSEFIQKTVTESGLRIPKKITQDQKRQFVEFFRIINKHDAKPDRDHLLAVARFFKNDQVLDNLSRPQLVAMARYMNLRPFGTDPMLRYQIRYRLLQLMKDDRAIEYEGVESLSIPELQSACASRGIKTSSVSPARLRDDLKIWLELRLRQKIPSTLLILSSTFTYGEHADDLDNYYDALLAVLSSIPDEVYNVTKAEIEDLDSKLKLNLLKEQDELIKEENEQQKDQVIKDDLKLSDYEEETEKEEPKEEVTEKEEEPKEEETEKEVKKNQPEDAEQRRKKSELDKVDSKN